MKKIIVTVAAIISVLVLGVMLAGCSSNAAGTYKFQSMKYSEGGMEMNYEVGKEIMGVSISEDFMVLELKDDGTFSMTTKMSGTETETGTWTQEGKTVKLKVSGVEQTATLSGSTLVLEMEEEGTSSSVTFKKQ